MTPESRLQVRSFTSKRSTPIMDRSATALLLDTQDTLVDPLTITRIEKKKMFSICRPQFLASYKNPKN